jgi:tRNA-dihydrouridine synthase
MYRGEVDRKAIRRLGEALDIPVLANGDVREAEDGVSLLRETGCDGVLVGRGATRNPWIFRQIEARLSGGRLPEPTLEDRRDLILEHFRTVVEREDPTYALHKLRLFTRWYSHGLPRGQELRRRIGSFPTSEVFLHGVEGFFEELLLDSAA